MLHQLHHDRNYIASLEAERPRHPTWALSADATKLEGIVAAAGRGDQSAWSALVTRLRGRVLRVARFHGLNPYQADDVAQETWLRLYRNLDRVRDPRSIGAWVETTARRESLRALARTRREDLTDEEIGDELELDDPADELLDERRAALLAALAKLPDRQRRLMEILLSESAPSYRDVSLELGIPVGSIGPTRGRCLERLRQELAVLP